jgi:hypothetical protein
MHGNQYLYQTGVDQFLMKAFYTLYVPGVTQQNTNLFAVHAGDSLSAGEFQDTNGKWYYNIVDNNTNQYSSNEFVFTPDQSTAEWIVENMGGAVSNFGSVTFQSSWWSYSNSGVQNITSSAASTLWKLNEQVPGGSYGYICTSSVDGTGQGFNLRPSASAC